MGKKNSKKIAFFVVFAALILMISVIFVILFLFVLKNENKGIDCMPPISAEEKECLDSGRCYCETY